MRLLLKIKIKDKRMPFQKKYSQKILWSASKTIFQGFSLPLNTVLISNKPHNLLQPSLLFRASNGRVTQMRIGIGKLEQTKFLTDR